MRKQIVRMVLALLLASLLAACAGVGAPEQPTSAPGGDIQSTTAPSGGGAKTRLVFWSNGRHDLEFMNEQIALYNASNPDGIEVEYAVHTEDYPQLLELAWQSQEAPDIFISRPLNMSTLTKAGMIEPLDGYITPELRGFIGEHNFVEGVTLFGGKLYSLPSYGSTFRLIYNQDLFKQAGLSEPPKTLAEMVDYAKKLTEAGKAQDAYGFAINLKTPSNAWNRSLVPIARRSGLSDYNFQTGSYDFSGLKPILQTFRQMVDDGSMLPSYQSLDIDPLRSLFAEGKIGMYLSLSAEASVYAEGGQFPAKIAWAAAPVPTVDGSVKGAANIGRTDWVSISAQSQHKAEAWKFIQWLYRPEVLGKYHEQGLGISVLPGVLNGAARPSLKGIEYFIPDKTDALWPAAPVLTIEGKNADAVYADYVLGVNDDLDAALSDLTLRYNQALESGVSSGSLQKPVIPDFDPINLQAK